MKDMNDIRESAYSMVTIFSAALRSLMADRKAFILSAAGMFINNLLYFMIWWMVFDMVGSVKGWTMAHIATMYGTVAFAYGVAFFFGGGVRDLAWAIESGRLDIYLGRPRHPLPTLMLTESRPSALGDVVTGLVLWFTLGGLSPIQGLLALLMGTAASVIVLSVVTAINCLAFWKTGARSMVDQLFDSFIIASSAQQNVLPVPVKLILLSVVPAGFVGLVPVEAIFHPSPWAVCGMLAAAFFYAGTAVWIFNRGLRRYTSGNMMVAGL